MLTVVGTPWALVVNAIIGIVVITLWTRIGR